MFAAPASRISSANVVLACGGGGVLDKYFCGNVVTRDVFAIRRPIASGERWAVVAAPSKRLVYLGAWMDCVVSYRHISPLGKSAPQAQILRISAQSATLPCLSRRAFRRYMLSQQPLLLNAAQGFSLVVQNLAFFTPQSCNGPSPQPTRTQ